jgi:prepilin-type N-terminal cleavage/methylation domain-containing protein
LLRTAVPAGAPGFSLLELAVVVGILSIVAAVALPVSRHLIERARTSAVLNDLRVFSAAFQTYAAEHGDWPPGDGTPAAIPAGMEPYLSKTNWRQRTPIGGHYAWDPQTIQQGSRYRAAIALVGTADNPVSRDAHQLQQIDEAFDDGNLTTGNFLLGYRNQPFYVLEH